MDDKEFVTNIINEVLQDNLAHYENSLKNLSNRKDLPKGSWRDGIEVYNNLSNEEDREKLINFIKMVMIDTISNLLGIIDGVSNIAENQTEDFEFSYKGVKLNDDLQDIFLEETENF